MSDIKKYLEGSQKVNNLSVPINIEKDSEHKRIVIGFATLDNVDLTNDVITAEASLKAFEEFRGNVRLQHDKLRPVGKVVDFAPATYFDPKTSKEYQGIQVAVAVSDAAEDVWKMCLDGTLSGFSIGGRVREQAPEYREDIEQTVQVIKSYQLTELSLVDNPANHLANVQTIYKSNDGASDESNMSLYGVIHKVLEIETKGDYPKMPEETTETVAPIDEVVTDSPVVADTVETPEVEVEADTKDNKPTLEQVIAQLSEQIADQSKNVSESVTKSLSDSISEQFVTVKSDFDARIEELKAETQKSIEGPIAELASKITKIEENLVSTEKSISAINENSAISKSLETEPIEKSVESNEPEDIWSGAFSDKYGD